MADALSETTIGRALLALWEDLPLWVMADMALAVSLLPSVAAWLLGSTLLSIALSFPAVFVVAGMASALAQPVRERTPCWRDFLKGNCAAALSIWVVLAAIMASFVIAAPAPVFAVQCLVAAGALMLAPFVLSVSALWRVNLRFAWRTAFVLAVCHPLVSAGLLAVAAMLGWLVVVSNGVLFVIAPAVWVSMALHSANELVETHCAVKTALQDRQTFRAWK